MSDTYPDALVYIAYAHADSVRVEPVVALLRAQGFTIHFDAATAHGGGNYVHESQRALRQARALVVFVSQAAAQSPWVEAEVRAYQAQMAQDPQRILIPVRLDDTPLPPSLAHYVALDGTSAQPAGVADALGSALMRALPAPLAIEQERGAPPPDDDAETSWGAPPAPAADAQGKGITNWPDIGTASVAAPDMAFPDAEPAPWAPPPPEMVAPPPAPAPPPYEPPTYAPPAPPAYGPPAYPPPPAPGGSHTTGAPAPRPAPKPAPKPAPRPVSLEQVTFTAYHPREIQPQQWQPLVVYIALDSPATMALVAAAAAERLAGKLDQFRPARSDKAAGLARGAALRIVPLVPGFQFNPGHLDVTWQEDVQQHEFRMRAETAQPGRAVNGVVQFYQGIVLRAEVPISVFVGQAVARLDSPDAYAQAIARAYRRIFASYSHQDMPVVESCESAAHTMGDQYLRDVTLLQSGVQWDPRLIQAINDADIFQLFWSKRAATSPFVEREWRHALKLLPVRPNFIRPVYWTRQLYPTPPELNALHFQPLSLSSLGWGRLRAAWYELRNR